MDQEAVREIRQLRRQVRLMGGSLLAVVALGLIGASAGRSDVSQDLRVRSLTVVDANGVARVILGAPVPDPIINGRQGKRVAPAAGLILNGPDGNERGGYLTSDAGGEAVLTLDGADGGEVFKVTANPDAGASLFLLHQSGAAVALTTYRGQPELQMYESGGARLHAIPTDAPPMR